MSKTEIRVGGLGGQGVILCGSIIGKAAALFDGKQATLIQAFGPEARGSACSAQVTVSTEPIGYPYVKRPDILIVMSTDAYAQFIPTLKPGGMLLYESDLIKLGKDMGWKNRSKNNAVLVNPTKHFENTVEHPHTCSNIDPMIVTTNFFQSHVARSVRKHITFVHNSVRIRYWSVCKNLGKSMKETFSFLSLSTSV